MKHINKWLAAACVLFLLVIGALVTHVLSGGDNPPGDQWIINPDVIQRNARMQKQVYQLQVQELSEKNSQLQTELVRTRQTLQTLKRKSKQREEVIQELILPKVGMITSSTEDSLQCDTLRREVAAYIQEVNEKDSIYERQINTMDSVLRVKDSTIVLQDKRMVSLDYDLQLISTQVNLLAQENKSLIKQERKRKVASTLKTIGVAIAVGVVTSFVSSR